MMKLAIKTFILLALGMSVVISSMIAPSMSASETKIWYRDQVAVLMYHHVHDSAKSTGTITTRLFTDQLAYLRGQGYQFITLKQFKRFLAGSSVPHNAVLVTFDDGYESFYENAYPVLKKMGIPAVVFVITGTLDNPLAGNIPYLSRDEIIAMTHDTGFIDAQCHSHALHGKTEAGEALLTGRLTIDGKKESPEEYRQRIMSDTTACIDSLKELYGEPVDSLAYPFGLSDKTSSEIVRQAGIRFAFTIVPEMATRSADPLQIPRINAGSPWITPEGLHHTIIRRVVATARPYDRVGLKDTLEQLGGKLEQDPDGTLHISYRDRAWTGKINSNKASSAARTMTLAKPIALKNGRAMISLDDLETLLGVPIIYDPDIGKFETRVTPDAH